MGRPGRARSLIDVVAAVDFVRDRGFVSAEEIHTHGLQAWDASRSHSVVVIEVGGGGRPVHRGLVVKSPGLVVDERQGSFDRERLIYRLVAEHPALAGLAPRVLAASLEDPLVVERADGLALTELLVGTERNDPGVLGATAALIGRWHRLAPGAGLPPLRPWVFDACGPDRPGFLETNPGASSLLGGHSEDWAPGLASSSAAWTPESAVHGDLRYDNVIVGEAGPVLVDWECAALGDPAWDLGALVSEILVRSGVRRMTARLAPGVRSAIDVVRSSYLVAAARPASDDWSRRVGLLCGSRLAMRALQTAAVQLEPEPDAYRLADLATQVLDDPACL